MRNWPCGFPGGGGLMGASAHWMVCSSPDCVKAAKKPSVKPKKKKRTYTSSKH